MRQQSTQGLMSHTRVLLELYPRYPTHYSVDFTAGERVRDAWLFNSLRRE